MKMLSKLTIQATSFLILMALGACSPQSVPVTLNTAVSLNDYFEILRGTTWDAVSPSTLPGGSLDYFSFDKTTTQIRDLLTGIWTDYDLGTGTCTHSLHFQDSNGVHHCLTFREDPANPTKYILYDDYLKADFLLK